MRLLTDWDGFAPASTAAWNASRGGIHSRVPVNTILLENNRTSGSGSPRGVKSLALSDLDDLDDEGVALENGLYSSRW